MGHNQIAGNKRGFMDSVAAELNDTPIKRMRMDGQGSAGSEGSGGNLLDADPVAKTSYEPSKVDCLKKTTCIIQTQQPIDIGNGEWHDLPFQEVTPVRGQPPQQILRIQDMPTSQLLGLVSNEDSSAERQFRQQQSNDVTATQYIYGKFHDFNIKFKNFITQIRNTTQGGGGLQTKDEVVFQIRRVYSRYMWNRNGAIEEQTNTVTFTLSTLNQGLNMHFLFDHKGWETLADLQNNSDYYPLGNYIAGPLSLQKPDQKSKIFIETVPWRYQIRLANFVALTGEQVVLTYQTEINSNFTLMGRLQQGGITIPIPNSIPATVSRKDDVKARYSKIN